MDTQLLQIVRSHPIFTASTIAFTSSIILPLLSFIYTNIRPSSLLRYHHGPSEPWALVTGASDGIGQGFASELAANGFNVILHGRNKSKLDSKIAQLSSQHPSRKFRTLVVDATDRSSWSDLESFADQLKAENLNLTILVNNIGGAPGTRTFIPLASRTMAEVSSTIDMNAVFPSQVTRTFLPILQQSTPSLILNIGSAACYLAIPYLETYAASKSYNLTFSNALRAEMRMAASPSSSTKPEVEVLALVVGKVSSAGTRNISTSFFIPSSQTLARHALQKIGCGHAVATAYWRHAVQFSGMLILPGWAKEMVFAGLAREEMELARKAS